jgi:hypothetical protein
MSWRNLSGNFSRFPSWHSRSLLIFRHSFHNMLKMPWFVNKLDDCF